MIKMPKKNLKSETLKFWIIPLILSTVLAFLAFRYAIIKKAPLYFWIYAGIVCLVNVEFIYYAMMEEEKNTKEWIQIKGTSLLGGVVVTALYCAVVSLVIIIIKAFVESIIKYTKTWINTTLIFLAIVSILFVYFYGNKKLAERWKRKK